MANGLSKAITAAVVRRLAGPQSYLRGMAYFSQGHVESIEETGNGVRALVRGTQAYTVSLTAAGGVLDYSCACPIGDDGDFCKHCVAAALAWLNREAIPLKPSARSKTRELTLVDAGKCLHNEDNDTLVKMMLDWAKDDDLLHQRLILYAARRSAPGTGASAVQRAFERAVRVHDFVHYREAAGNLFYAVRRDGDQNKLLTMEVESGRVLRSLPIEGAGPAFTSFIGGSLHPDGKRLALQRAESASDIWMLEGLPQPESGWMRIFRHWARP